MDALSTPLGRIVEDVSFPLRDGWVSTPFAGRLAPRLIRVTTRSSGPTPRPRQRFVDVSGSRHRGDGHDGDVPRRARLLLLGRLPALSVHRRSLNRRRSYGSQPCATKLIVEPGQRLKLSKRKTDETFGWDKETAKAELVEEIAELAVLQNRLYAEGGQSLLVVLQAMDAAGKDGVIRSIFTGLNPAGVRVTSFKVPAGREAEQDYLWRVHASCPAKGEIGVFNRSHYEDVLVVRVKKFVAEERWSEALPPHPRVRTAARRRGHADREVYLHVSKEEQRLRLQDRVDDPEERWKFRSGDLDDRELWDEYHEAYEDAISDDQHGRGAVVRGPRRPQVGPQPGRRPPAAHTLEHMDPQLPPPEDGIEGLQVV